LFRSLLAAAEASIGQLLADADHLRSAYLAAAADAFRSWAPGAAAARVSANAYHLDRAADRVQELNHAVEALMSEASNLVEKDLGAADLWPHLSESGRESLRHRALGPWGDDDRPARRHRYGGYLGQVAYLQGELARLLAEHEIEANRFASPWRFRAAEDKYDWDTDDRLATAALTAADSGYQELCGALVAELRRKAHAQTALMQISVDEPRI
jgi:hypothetical protein